MTTQLHVGRKRTQTTAGDDGSVIPPGALTVSVVPPGIVSAPVDPATNNVLLTGISIGSATITYHAAGFTDGQDIVNVSAPPTIVATDGPEV